MVAHSDAFGHTLGTLPVACGATPDLGEPPFWLVWRVVAGWGSFPASLMGLGSATPPRTQGVMVVPAIPPWPLWSPSPVAAIPHARDGIGNHSQ
jgi:hypothetical protein